MSYFKTDRYRTAVDAPGRLPLAAARHGADPDPTDTTYGGDDGFDTDGIRQ